jgi:hypothetical protein
MQLQWLYGSKLMGGRVWVLEANAVICPSCMLDSSLPARLRVGW